MDTDRADADRLCRLIDASPTPYHAAATAAGELEAAGFVEITGDGDWGDGAGFIRRGGSLVAWGAAHRSSRFRVIGAHTDSPNLRINPTPDHESVGLRQFNVEVYGGTLLNTWLDRDLGVAGRAVVRADGGTDTRVFRLDEPVLRIAQLAIHLDRDVNSKGLQLNPQDHLRPFWTDLDDETGFVDLVAAAIDADPDDVLSWDAMVFDINPSRRIGAGGAFVSAPRLDNLCSSFCAVDALISTGQAPSPPDARPVVCLYDHEEVGSTSTTGADGTLLARVLERLVDGGIAELHDAAARSVCLSADMAHATHPNYVDRHEPDHRIEMNGGPVVKVNASQRYASDAETTATFRLACDAAGVPMQTFVSRNDMPCGSTIGPVTSARLGMPTVDVGIGQLAMHSAREICGADDVTHYRAAMTAFLHG